MTLVIKIGGAAGVATDRILDELVAYLANPGNDRRVVLVHGGSDLTNDTQISLSSLRQKVFNWAKWQNRRGSHLWLATSAQATDKAGRRAVYHALTPPHLLQHTATESFGIGASDLHIWRDQVECIYGPPY